MYSNRSCNSRPTIPNRFATGRPLGQASEHKALAYQFIDFLNEPTIAARLAQFVYYATANKAAEALLPEEFLEDPVIYPPPQVLKHSEVYTHLPPRAQKRRNGIFARLLQ